MYQAVLGVSVTEEKHVDVKTTCLTEERKHRDTQKGLLQTPVTYSL